jgi:mersacidin/lichenicidin family type 2 lantibiotic
MTHEQIVRAWKDEDYRHGLSGEELSALPEHPAGLIELSDQSLGDIAGQEEAIPSFGAICLITMVTWYVCLTPDVNEWISKNLVCKP